MLGLIDSLRAGAGALKPPIQNPFAMMVAARDGPRAVVQEGPSPVGEALGHHRILRTSPLTEVPFVCCTDY